MIWRSTIICLVQSIRWKIVRKKSFKASLTCYLDCLIFVTLQEWIQLNIMCCIQSILLHVLVRSHFRPVIVTFVWEPFSRNKDGFTRRLHVSKKQLKLEVLLLVTVCMTLVYFTKWWITFQRHYRHFRYRLSSDNNSTVKTLTRSLKLMNLWAAFMLTLMISKLLFLSMKRHSECDVQILSRHSMKTFLIWFMNFTTSYVFISKWVNPIWKDQKYTLI